MGFDMDLHRTASTAFGPASLVAGGVLPYEGRIFVKSTGTQEAAFEHLTGALRAGDTVLVKSSHSAGLRFLGDRLGGSFS